MIEAHATRSPTLGKSKCVTREKGRPSMLKNPFGLSEENTVFAHRFVTEHRSDVGVVTRRNHFDPHLIVDVIVNQSDVQCLILAISLHLARRPYQPGLEVPYSSCIRFIGLFSDGCASSLAQEKAHCVARTCDHTSALIEDNPLVVDEHHSRNIL